MSTRRRWPVAGMVAAGGVAAWWAMAAGSPPIAGEPGITGERHELTAAEAAGPWPPPLGPGEVEAHTQTVGGIHRLDVGPVPGGIAVAAEASLWDAGPDISPYFWAVDILEHPGGKLVSTREYRDQMFELTPGEEARPTFADRFAVPAGHYFARVRLETARRRWLRGGQPENAGTELSHGGEVEVEAAP